MDRRLKKDILPEIKRDFEKVMRIYKRFPKGTMKEKFEIFIQKFANNDFSPDAPIKEQ